ncbi:YqzE family protein [Bacillus sp. PS06]|uniref:YqzE family protein n=1 Tax=Bacillus sp. PS06 TaxID=2764176 RepID=UPI00178275D1|nr:YqzE family protein [Bacillus sp. PS06]MBD8071330.1 YqzE family protein [Bacillus sp. PS06]
MSTNDYVKFMTQQIVSYMDQPKELRRETKQRKKTERAPFTSQWFGVLPVAFSLMFKKKNR